MDTETTNVRGTSTLSPEWSWVCYQEPHIMEGVLTTSRKVPQAAHPFWWQHKIWRVSIKNHFRQCLFSSLLLSTSTSHNSQVFGNSESSKMVDALCILAIWVFKPLWETASKSQVGHLMIFFLLFFHCTSTLFVNSVHFFSTSFSFISKLTILIYFSSITVSFYFT